METLLYFLLFGGLIFLMMRFGCGSHIMGHGHGKQGEPAEGSGGTPAGPRWVAPNEEVDPVCGKAVATAIAKSAVHDGWVYYFCSSACRERFEAAPASYLGKRRAALPAHMEHSHG
jgi:YHS domain-containing protein